jgi:methylmalonyl-CoA/ethylmalonyl-CoA epimerase
MKKVSHIGIAVFSIEEALVFYRDTLGLEVAGIEAVEQEGVRVAFLPVGETRIELLEPLGDASPLRKFLEKHGEGVHHVALETSNLVETARHLEQKGIRILGEPRKGGGGAFITFVHPKSAHGVLLELCQEKVN